MMLHGGIELDHTRFVVHIHRVCSFQRFKMGGEIFSLDFLNNEMNLRELIINTNLLRYPQHHSK